MTKLIDDNQQQTDIEADELKKRIGGSFSSTVDSTKFLEEYDEALAKILKTYSKNLGLEEGELDNFKKKFQSSQTKEADKKEQDSSWARAFLDQLDSDDETKRNKRFADAPEAHKEINKLNREFVKKIYQGDFQELEITNSTKILEIKTHGKVLNIPVENGMVVPPTHIDPSQGPLTLTFARTRGIGGPNMSAEGAVYDVFTYGKDGKLKSINSPVGEIHDQDGVKVFSKVSNLKELQDQLAKNLGVIKGRAVDAVALNSPETIGKSPELPSQGSFEAAVKIQKVARGRAARNELKKQNAAATTIQRVVRGKAGRQKIAEGNTLSIPDHLTVSLPTSAFTQGTNPEVSIEDHKEPIINNQNTNLDQNNNDQSLQDLTPSVTGQENNNSSPSIAVPNNDQSPQDLTPSAIGQENNNSSPSIAVPTELNSNPSLTLKDDLNNVTSEPSSSTLKGNDDQQSFTAGKGYDASTKEVKDETKNIDDNKVNPQNRNVEKDTEVISDSMGGAKENTTADNTSVSLPHNPSAEEKAAFEQLVAKKLETPISKQNFNEFSTDAQSVFSGAETPLARHDDFRLNKTLVRPLSSSGKTDDKNIVSQSTTISSDEINVYIGQVQENITKFNELINSKNIQLNDMQKELLTALEDNAAELKKTSSVESFNKLQESYNKGMQELQKYSSVNNERKTEQKIDDNINPIIGSSNEFSGFQGVNNNYPQESEANKQDLNSAPSIPAPGGEDKIYKNTTSIGKEGYESLRPPPIDTKNLNIPSGMKPPGGNKEIDNLSAPISPINYADGIMTKTNNTGNLSPRSDIISSFTNITGQVASYTLRKQVVETKENIRQQAVLSSSTPAIASSDLKEGANVGPESAGSSATSPEAQKNYISKSGSITKDKVRKNRIIEVQSKDPTAEQRMSLGAAEVRSGAVNVSRSKNWGVGKENDDGNRQIFSPRSNGIDSPISVSDGVADQEKDTSGARVRENNNNRKVVPKKSATSSLSNQSRSYNDELVIDGGVESPRVPPQEKEKKSKTSGAKRDKKEIKGSALVGVDPNAPIVSGKQDVPSTKPIKRENARGEQSVVSSNTYIADDVAFAQNSIKQEKQKFSATNTRDPINPIFTDGNEDLNRVASRKDDLKILQKNRLAGGYLEENVGLQSGVNTSGLGRYGKQNVEDDIASSSSTPLSSPRNEEKSNISQSNIPEDYLKDMDPNKIDWTTDAFKSAAQAKLESKEAVAARNKKKIAQKKEKSTKDVSGVDEKQLKKEQIKSVHKKNAEEFERLKEAKNNSSGYDNSASYYPRYSSSNKTIDIIGKQVKEIRALKEQKNPNKDVSGGQSKRPDNNFQPGTVQDRYRPTTDGKTMKANPRNINEVASSLVQRMKYDQRNNAISSSGSLSPSVSPKISTNNKDPQAGVV